MVQGSRDNDIKDVNVSSSVRCVYGNRVCDCVVNVMRRTVSVSVCVGVCVRLVRTERKSLARVLTPSALDPSLCVSCNACCDAVCALAAPSPRLCVNGRC